MAGVPANFHIVIAAYDEIIIPIPLAQTLKCGYCNHGRSGRYATADKLSKIRTHIASKHPEVTVDPWRFQCAKCRQIFETQEGASVHQKDQCPLKNADPVTYFSNLSADAPIANSYFANGRLTMWYKVGKPSLCPFNHTCSSGFITTAGEPTAQMNSMDKHLRSLLHEQVVTDKIWRCTKCKVEMNGNSMKAHFPKCNSIRLEQEFLANGHPNDPPAASGTMTSHSSAPNDDQTVLDSVSELLAEVLPTPQIDPSPSGATSIGEGEHLSQELLADLLDPPSIYEAHISAGEPHPEVPPTPQTDPSPSGVTSMGEGEQLLYALLGDQSDPSPIDVTPIGEGEQLPERPPTAHADPISSEVASSGETEQDPHTLLLELIGDMSAGFDSIIEGTTIASPPSNY